MSAEIRMEGLEEVLERIDKIKDPQQIYQALGRACALVERSAKQKAPKDNGDLRRSISSKIDKQNLQGIVFTPLEYAPYVEYGTGLFAEGGGRMDVPWHYQDEEGEWHSTSGMKPQPYMRPALNENVQQIKDIIREGLTE